MRTWGGAGGSLHVQAPGPAKARPIAKEPGVLPIGRAIPGADALLFGRAFAGRQVCSWL